MIAVLLINFLCDSLYLINCYLIACHHQCLNNVSFVKTLYSLPLLLKRPMSASKKYYLDGTKQSEEIFITFRHFFQSLFAPAGIGFKEFAASFQRFSLNLYVKSLVNFPEIICGLFSRKLIKNSFGALLI